MAKKITLTIADDAKAKEIRDVIIEHMAHPPYEETIEDPSWEYDENNPTMPKRVKNPVSRDDFFKKHIIQTIQNQYRRAKRNQIQKHELDAVEKEDLGID
jgi:hypothetical protein